MPDFADRLASLLERRLPLRVESAGGEDDWNVVGPALLAASVRHLRAIQHLQHNFPSGVVGWQLVRSMYEYATTYAWIAGDPQERGRLWLKADYQQRMKLADDLAAFGDSLLTDAQRERIGAYVAEVAASMSSVPDRATDVDDRWGNALQEIDAHLPAEFRRFRALYPLIYRNGSRFTHPSTHGVNVFVSGRPRHLSVGEEHPLERDLVVLATGILAIGLTVAVTATSALELTYDDIRAALSD